MTSVDSPVLDKSQRSSLNPSFRFSQIDALCRLCLGTFDDDEPRVLVDGKSCHTNCFRCAQCFVFLDKDAFYNFEGRYYCSHDFFTLYAPICRKCNKFIEGKVKYTLSAAYHPQCFTCVSCEERITDNVWHIDGMMYCTSCKGNKAKKPVYRCQKCKLIIDEDELLRKDHNFYHACHFKCHDCKRELTKDAHLIKDIFYCQRCYDLRSHICADCKKPIDGESERSVLALGKHYHPDHFRCYHCGRPFMGTEYFERNNNAYCKTDFMKLFAECCFICNTPITGTAIRNFGKSWCVECYHCMMCWKLLKHSEKVASVDDQPMCKKCLKSKKYQKVLKIKAKESALENQST